ncbi:MAG TPA: HisA/HisF-related TIM barrel protein, partial [Candidatus Limnocylindria bacterium]|nr:HisA/HisF-related TIM barrel protein [Candidatus Limnocylindria bacterium]
MELIAAVDLLGGGAVRLAQGDYARETMREADPAGLAARWVALGVRALHVVDLDGARAREPRQLPLLASLVAAAREADPSVRIESGGGLRNVDGAGAAFATGVDDVVLGTAAIERPGFVA